MTGQHHGTGHGGQASHQDLHGDHHHNHHVNHGVHGNISHIDFGGYDIYDTHHQVVGTHHK